MFFDIYRPPVRLPLSRTPIVTPILSSCTEERPRASPPAHEVSFECDRCRELLEANHALQLELEFERARASKMERDAAWKVTCKEASQISTGLDDLTPAQLSELRQLKRPPPVVKSVIDALCALLGAASDRMLLSDPLLIAKLRSFTASSVGEETLYKVRSLIEGLSYDRVAAASKPGATLYRWLMGVSQVATDTTPRRLLMLSSVIHQP